MDAGERTFLRTLGHPVLRRGDGSVVDGLRRKDLALLAYLCVEGDRPFSRAHLAALLWGESPEERARHSLTQALRRAAAGVGRGTLAMERDTVRWTGAAGCDAQLLLEGNERLDELLTLYEGPFLEGFEAGFGSQDFSAWADARRAELRRAAVRWLDRMGERAERENDWPRALRIGERSVQIDREWEGGHRRVMRALLERGERNLALRHFREFARWLTYEIGGQPDPETMALADVIRATAAFPPAAPRVKPDAAHAPVDVRVEANETLPHEGGAAAIVPAASPEDVDRPIEVLPHVDQAPSPPVEWEHERRPGDAPVSAPEFGRERRGTEDGEPGERPRGGSEPHRADAPPALSLRSSPADPGLREPPASIQRPSSGRTAGEGGITRARMPGTGDRGEAPISAGVSGERWDARVFAGAAMEEGGVGPALRALGGRRVTAAATLAVLGMAAVFAAGFWSARPSPRAGEVIGRGEVIRAEGDRTAYLAFSAALYAFPDQATLRRCLGGWPRVRRVRALPEIPRYTLPSVRANGWIGVPGAVIADDPGAQTQYVSVGCVLSPIPDASTFRAVFGHTDWSRSARAPDSLLQHMPRIGLAYPFPVRPAGTLIQGPGGSIRWVAYHGGALTVPGTAVLATYCRTPAEAVPVTDAEFRYYDSRADLPPASVPCRPRAFRGGKARRVRSPGR